MTSMARGKLRGRWAFGLPTGMGKTSAIIAWIATLAALKLDHISVAVSASKVEALCQLKRDLIKQGVAEKRIGLLHSYRYSPRMNPGDGWASEPSTEDSDRQIMLVTHSRVHNAGRVRQFGEFNGQPRDLLLYDESLIVSESTGVQLRELRGAIGLLRGKYRDSEKHQGVIGYLMECERLLDEALGRVKQDGSKGIITLPSLDEPTRSTFTSVLGRSGSAGGSQKRGRSC